MCISTIFWHPADNEPASLDEIPKSRYWFERLELYRIAKFPALEFPTRIRLTFSDNWLAYFIFLLQQVENREKIVDISGSKSLVRCRGALPLATISSVTSFSSLFPFPLVSFFFRSALSLIYMLLVWPVTYAPIRVLEWNCFRSEKCFWWRVQLFLHGFGITFSHRGDEID